jgi:hypothetical protein
MASPCRPARCAPGRSAPRRAPTAASTARRRRSSWPGTAAPRRGGRLQPVADEEQHQRGRHRAGNAVEHEHRQQAAKGRRAPGQRQAHGLGGRAGVASGGGGARAAPGQASQRQRQTPHGHRPGRPPPAARWPPARPPAPGLRATPRCARCPRRRPGARPRPGAARSARCRPGRSRPAGRAPPAGRCWPCTGGKNSAVEAQRQHSAAASTAASTRAPWANQPVAQARPISGSATASSRRAPSSSAPSVASGMPNSLA